ncbi:hypothetical protein MXL39_05810 [Enterobacter sichuanensis]|uniref:hypothetical protein n=1 Tax=Enterobacter sichuanensis TaxID=2071710 RepID=UPI002DBBE3D1|nr:hypothetical protein [Enterobacter sichuanensis]MEB5959752.1 hypothetical protein [Enterobacter sichuanensis]
METFEKITRPYVVLYESRHLFRSAAINLFEEQGCNIVTVKPDMPIKESLGIQNTSALVAIGLNGAGRDIFSILHDIYHLASQSFQIIVWVRWEFRILKKLLLALGVRHVFIEYVLYEELTDFFSVPRYISEHWITQPKQHHSKILTNTELRTLLDMSKGLSVSCIALYRNRDSKTIYAHKRNARSRLEMDDSEWLDMLSKISLIYSLGF